MFKKVFKFMTVLSLFILAACGSQQGDTEGKEAKKLVIEHKLGTTEITGKPERVVVFDYGVLDMIAYLEDVEVVGVARGSTYLPELSKYADKEKYPTIGTLFEPNFEKLFELKPDLILISRRQAPLYKDLSQIAPTVYIQSVGDSYFEDLSRSAEILGDIFDQKDTLEKKITEITDRLAAIKERAKDHTALFVLANGGTLSVYGEGSRYDHLYSSFGFKAADDNIEKASHGNKVSYEYFYEKNPDYLFVLDKASISGQEVTAKETMDNDIMRSLDAYKNDRIVYVSPNSWYLLMGGLKSSETIVNEIEASLK